MKKKLVTGVLVSGSGSNLQSIIDGIDAGILDATIGIVVSNVADAYALERAAKHGIRTAVIDHRVYENRVSFEEALIRKLRSASVELVVMAGFMRILSGHFLSAFHRKIMNIHPALLPSFQGTHAQQRAFEYGVQFAGCTVHFADDGVDTGPIIIQSVVPVLPDDTPETLQERILREEHRIYPQAIQFYAEGRIEVRGRKVIIKNRRPHPVTSFHNPPLEGF
ncbi:MAG: phosphoribosylglycinamide formyltransferase [Syntrophales bacterium]|jgi:phosphoribosylglycinamide formyltransferase-1|nr:phosphoribosylglycinamide formyltransferase [Syntrophales bacterium]MCK9527255.1 phosphoribosylglycinamide formyltransferase [Syntrophales bacterium]MDX9921275.1 phosphoribosylglycinamide formyltransferase [Syntrophales bacterium]